MKSLRFISSSRRLAVLFAASALASSALAQVTWDADTGTTGAQDGSGTWNLSNTNWWNGTTNVTYPLNTATTFGAGTDGTYAIDLDSALALTANTTFTFANSGYTLSANEARTISNTGSTTLSVASGKIATIGNNITISSSFGSNPAIRLTGAGTLILESGSTIRTTNTTLSQLAIGTSTNTNGIVTVQVKAGALIDSARILRIENGTLWVDGGNVQSVTTTATADGFSMGASANFNATTNPATVLTVDSGAFSAVGTRHGISLSGGGSPTGLNGGIINLNGGTIVTSNIQSNAGTSGNARGVVNFNGGVLRVHADANATQRQAFIAGFADALTGNNNKRALVQAGGAKIDTNGFTDVEIDSALVSGTAGDGGLTLNDTATIAGRLTLNAANTYNGLTYVQRGTLALGTTGSIANSSGIRIASGATFDSSALASFTAPANVRFDIGAASAGFLNAQGISFGGLTFNLDTGSPAASYDLWTTTSAPSITSIGLSGSGFSGSLADGDLDGIWTGSSNGYDITFTAASGALEFAAVIPEPASFAALAGLGALGLAASRRRRA